ncbi:MAG: TenA family protein [Myxococcales bacterium]|nr:TenA family protein [Myxococcales bacterium]
MKLTAEELWKLNRDTADACLAHPFVQGIGSGDLSRERFRVYVAQDAYFLEAFARAYALALAKSPDREGIAVFKDLLVGVFEELTLHEGYAARWGVSLEPEPLPSTSTYCDFLLRTASLEPVGHTAAAMAPCMRLYAFLGQQLAPKLNPESPYREWVKTYASADTKALASRRPALTPMLRPTFR